MTGYGDSFLLAPFQEFYAEIIRLKLMAGAGTWVAPRPQAGVAANPDEVQTEAGTWVYFPDVMVDASTDDVANTAASWVTVAENTTALSLVDGNKRSPASMMDAQSQPSDSFRVSTMVWHRLVALFQRQAVAAWRQGGSYGAEFYKDAQYVMVALADEIFLHMDWEGQAAWVSNLLESRIFRTHAAGQVFYEKLDRLLREQNPLERDLAAVYLMALSLGFKGKYYGRNDRGQLARYRRQLFAFIYGREPDLDDESQHVFAEAYYHNVREESQRKLADPRKWIALLCFVIIIYTAATQLIWIQFTQELNTVNQGISKIIGELKTQP